MEAREVLVCEQHRLLRALSVDMAASQRLYRMYFSKDTAKQMYLFFLVVFFSQKNGKKYNALIPKVFGNKLVSQQLRHVNQPYAVVAEMCLKVCPLQRKSEMNTWDLVEVN